MSSNVTSEVGRAKGWVEGDGGCAGDHETRCTHAQASLTTKVKVFWDGIPLVTR